MSKEKQLPKPTAAILAHRTTLEKESKQDELLDLLNSYDWSCEVFEENGKYGLKSCVGKVLLPAKFDNFKALANVHVNEGQKMVAMQDGKYGILRADGIGKWIVAPEFDEIGYPNIITSVYKDGKWGVINTSSGELIIPAELDLIYGGNDFIFNNGMAYFEKDGKVGVMNEDVEFTEAIFDEAEPDEHGVIVVKLNGKEGFIDENGQFTEDEDEAWFMESEF